MSARRQTRRRPRAVSLRQEARPKPAQRGSSRRPTDCIARATSEALEGPARQSLSREQISGPAKKHGDRLAPIWSAHFQPRPDGATAWSTGLKTRGGAALAKIRTTTRNRGHEPCGRLARSGPALRLSLPSVPQGRRRKVIDLDLSPLCQKARFLDYQGWPAYARTCADTAVGAGDLSCGELDEVMVGCRCGRRSDRGRAGR